MPPRRAATAFLSAAVIGVLGGLIGLGGAEFRLPILCGVLGYSARQAVPINLSIGLVTLLTALPARIFALSGENAALAIAAHLPEVAALAAGAAVAGFFGVTAMRRMADRSLARAIAVLLVLLGLVMIAESWFDGDWPVLLPDGPLRIIAALAAGLVIGTVSSMFGIAGGELTIPTLILGFGLPMKLAGSLSLLVNLPTVSIAVLRYLRSGGYDRAAWRNAILPMGAGSILGAAAGGLMLGIVPADLLKTGLGVILIWSALRTYRHLAPKQPARETA